MIYGNKNAVDVEEDEMGSGGVQYKAEESKFPNLKTSPCLFKNLLFGLMAAFSLCVVAVMTWIISKSAYQVETSDTPENDVISAAYLLSSMDLSVDPCEDFYQYACGSWVRNQWKDDVSAISLEGDQYDEKIQKYLTEDVLDTDLVSYKNVKLLYQKCLSDDSDVTDVTDWINKVFDFSTAEEVMNFAAELGVFVLYEVNVDLSPLRMDPISNYIMRLNEEMISTLIDSLPDDLGQKDNVLKFINARVSLGSQSLAETTMNDFIEHTTFVNLTDHFKTFGLAPPDGIRADPRIIQETSTFFSDSDNFADSGEILKFLKTYTGLSLQSQFTRLAQEERVVEMCYLSFATTYFGFTVGSLMLDREKANYTETLATVQEMVSVITEEYRQIVRQSELLSQEGKNSAISKLDNLEVLVGAAPWIKNDTHLRKLNFDGELDESMSFITMYKLVNTFRQRDRIQGLLRPDVSDLWEGTMGPQISLNAAYNQIKNSITIPIGAFIPPYFDIKWPLPMKYGALGSIIGHEITHAFDQDGMLYDSRGSHDDLWSSKDSKSMKDEQNCLIKQYNGFGHQDLLINGTQTLNENFADNGGLPVAYKAYKRAVKSQKAFKIHGLGLTPDMLFFLSYAQMRCYKYSYEELVFMYYSTDFVIKYSPPDFRVVGPIKNSNHFLRAFSCSSNCKMASSQRCRTL